MTKRHYIKPIDPQFVEDMSVDGYDAHLDLAKYAGVVSQEDIDKHNSGEISLKPIRTKYKAANYSCVYRSRVGYFSQRHRYLRERGW